MNEFQFKPEVAELYGVNEAIFLHSLSFWLIKNWSNGSNFHEGRYWSYDTYKDIAKRFPFWTPRQIERIVANCEEKGAILVDNFNEDKTVRTKWYTLAGAAESIYFPKSVECNSPSSELAAPQAVEPDGEDTPPISPNSELQNTEMDAPICQTVNRIKETVTNQLVSPYKPPRGRRPISVPKWKPERFDAFWTFYSDYARGEDRSGAVREWDKLKPSDELIAAMGTALKAQIASEAWQQGIGIPYAVRWLRNRRWEDKVAPAALAPASPGQPARRWGWDDG